MKNNTNIFMKLLVTLVLCLEPVQNLLTSGPTLETQIKKPEKFISVTNWKVSQHRTRNGDIMNLKPTGMRFGDIQASVLAALASRLSRGGSVLRATNGYGDKGRAYGILQCSLTTSGLPCEVCPWNSCCHIHMMVHELFMPYIKMVKNKHRSWTQEMVLQGAVAAYNFGVKNVQTWSRLDVGSWNNDFSNDVIARAQYLHTLGWN
ncbi:goose-type lysozyme 2 [Elysia marginata]|uniref:Goose-type lysozyme 2 n=1 Tax=Elysia marginata TaxID=1093978 RepID=A0AAV4GIR4_9GAST|nr:goose-type lysozyme 2 [Elysia marginata]